MMDYRELDHWISDVDKISEKSTAEIEAAREFFLDLKLLCQKKSDICRMELSRRKDIEIAELRVQIAQKQSAATP
ncbi:MAG: hypothetical protein ABJL67_15755 [Sulfitobacter sp.]